MKTSLCGISAFEKYTEYRVMWSNKKRPIHTEMDEPRCVMLKGNLAYTSFCSGEVSMHSVPDWQAGISGKVYSSLQIWPVPRNPQYLFKKHGSADSASGSPTLNPMDYILSGKFQLSCPSVNRNQGIGQSLVVNLALKEFIEKNWPVDEWYK